MSNPNIKKELQGKYGKILGSLLSQPSVAKSLANIKKTMSPKPKRKEYVHVPEKKSSTIRRKSSVADTPVVKHLTVKISQSKMNPATTKAPVLNKSPSGKIIITHFSESSGSSRKSSVSSLRNSIINAGTLLGDSPIKR